MVDIIAECCSNIILHLDKLESVIDTVAETGATHIKIQMFSHKSFPESEWVQKIPLEFPRDLFPRFVQLAHERGLKAGASVFDVEAVDVVESSGGDFLKLATREWNNLPLFHAAVTSSLPIIRSYNALKYADIEVEFPGRYTLMACIPQYPAVDFKMPKSLELQGWSSHTDFYMDVLAAVSRGAVCIEKHIEFRVDDPEHKWSLSPFIFKDMVNEIRMMEKWL